MGMNVDIGQITSRYPGRGRRESLRAVAELRSALPPHAEPPVVAVVGSNGKTSTATYLARLLEAAGVRTGRYTSPHLSSWGERVTFDGIPCDEGELADTLEEVHRLASAGLGSGELRFFDVLTLTAELLFARHGARLAIYEAGIGGRLDAVRLLKPWLTLLTGVARDHAEILGEDLEEVLREKLLVTPPGGTVLSLPLSERLQMRAESIASEVGFHLVWVDADAERLPSAGAALAEPMRRSLALAVAGRRWTETLLGAPPPKFSELEGIELGVPGRYERGRRDGVPYLLDNAHNEAAWRDLAVELGRRPPGGGDNPLVAVVSLSPDKDRGALARALALLPRLHSVVATRHIELPAVDPAVLAGALREAGLETSVAEDPARAMSLAFGRAHGLRAGIVVLGSTHLAGEVRRRLVSDQL